MPFADQIITEMKQNPFTLTLVLGLWIAVAVMWNGYAKASDVQQLNLKMQDFTYAFDHGHMDTRLHTTESELFVLKQQVKAALAAGKAPDPLYDTRIAQLESEHDQIVRDMTSLEQAHANRKTQ
jgi:hypothetical protein